jgi:hypothetical protein
MPPTAGTVRERLEKRLVRCERPFHEGSRVGRARPGQVRPLTTTLTTTSATTSALSQCGRRGGVTDQAARREKAGGEGSRIVAAVREAVREAQSPLAASRLDSNAARDLDLLRQATRST